MTAAEERLVVAVTGPTGTFGFGLIPLLEAEPRVERIVGIARRPFDPSEHGWSKMEYRRGDVRDEDALRQAFAGVDVVVHLAFMITGTAGAETNRAINIDGTVNGFRAARDAGARRFVYASSVAAYGFHKDNPVGLTEDWPTRPADRLFYAREKAELEQALQHEAAAVSSRRSICCGRRSCSGRTRWEPRARCRLPCRRGLPAGRAHRRGVAQASVRPTGRRLGGGAQPSRHHGHGQGQGGVGVAAAVHGDRGAARHAAPVGLTRGARHAAATGAPR